MRTRKKEREREKRGERKFTPPKLNFKPPPQSDSQLRKSKRKTYSPDNKLEPANKQDTDTQAAHLELKRKGEGQKHGAVSKSKSRQRQSPWEPPAQPWHLRGVPRTSISSLASESMASEIKISLQ